MQDGYLLVWLYFPRDGRRKTAHELLGVSHESNTPRRRSTLDQEAKQCLVAGVRGTRHGTSKTIRDYT